MVTVRIGNNALPGETLVPSNYNNTGVKIHREIWVIQSPVCLTMNMKDRKVLEKTKTNKQTKKHSSLI